MLRYAVVSFGVVAIEVSLIGTFFGWLWQGGVIDEGTIAPAVFTVIVVGLLTWIALVLRRLSRNKRLTSCPDCARLVSLSARACPNCGCDLMVHPVVVETANNPNPYQSPMSRR